MHKTLKKKLLDLYNDSGVERVGVILSDTKLVELENIAPNPQTQFLISAEDTLEYLLSGKAKGTFHTHPNASANLSVDDYTAFLNYPDIQHIIVGKDGIKIYEVADGAVIQQEDTSDTSREAEGTMLG